MLFGELCRLLLVIVLDSLGHGAKLRACRLDMSLRIWVSLREHLNHKHEPIPTVESARDDN